MAKKRTADTRDLAILIRDMLHTDVEFECFDWSDEDARFLHCERSIAFIDASDPSNLTIGLDDNSLFKVTVTRIG
jgi:hypothetical protein